MSTSRQHTEAVMQGLASGVDSILNGDQDDPLNTGRKYGFVLLVAEFGDIAEGRVNYVSNGDKAMMVAEAGMRALLRAGCDLLANEYDNLKASITMPDGSLSANPLDAWAVEKVAVIEDWIASVKAALYPATEASHGE